MVPAAFQKLHDDVDRCMRRAITVEEGIPMDDVTNFDEVKRAFVTLSEFLYLYTGTSIACLVSRAFI